MTDSDPKLERVTIEPQAHPLVVNQTEDLNVLAHYSDGSVRNVSKTCAYLSNEPAVVSVSNTGQIRAGNIPGEATITARYMGVIATWNTAIPRQGDIPPDAFNSLPRNNFIDELVYKKLKSLNVLPSPPCNDAEFLR